MKLNAINESALYSDDLIAARAFYEKKLGLECILYNRDQHAFFKINRSILLLFNRSYSANQSAMVNGNPVPAHATIGPGHIAFEAPEGEYHNCKADIINKGIAIESEIDWPSGAKSFYFRDPDGNSLEITEFNFWQTRTK